MSTPSLPSARMQEPPDPESLTAAIRSAIHASANLDDVLGEIKEDLGRLFNVEQLTFYGVDREKKELYSRFILNPLVKVPEIRVPITATSISGYCARYAKVVNIADAYDAAEVASISPQVRFDPSWDKRSGFRTRSMLAVPVFVERKYLMGVLLLINKRSGGRFLPEEESHAWDVAETLGIALRNQAQLAQRRPSKFDDLLARDLITWQALHEAFATARRKGMDVETVLIEDYHIAKKDLGQALSQFFGCPFIDFSDQMPVDHSLLRGMSFEFLQANYWVPLRREGNVVEVVVDNPKDLVKIEDIQLLLPGYSLRWAVGLRKDIERYLAYIRTQQTLMTQRFDISAAMEVSSSEIQSVTEVNTIIDDTLMQEAMRATGLTIKHAVVEAGLRLLVQVKAQTAVRRLRGKIVWEGSPATIRQQGAGGV